MVVLRGLERRREREGGAEDRDGDDDAADDAGASQLIGGYVGENGDAAHDRLSTNQFVPSLMSVTCS